MKKQLEVTRKDGKMIELMLRTLTLDDIDKLLALQNEVIEALGDKALYVPSDREEIESNMKAGGVHLGYMTETDTLVAVAIYLKCGYNAHNYGYDLGLEGEDLLKVGQVDTVLVQADYRGNKLQYIMCQLLEEVAQEQGTPIICATASPDNTFSVNNFLKLGYEIKVDKLKYGGLRRYVLMKQLEQ